MPWREGRYITWSSGSLRDRPIDLHFDFSIDQTLLFPALAECGKVRRVAMRLERRVVHVGFVKKEELGIGRGSVRAIDDAPRLRAEHNGSLLRQERGQCIAFAFRCPQ